MLEAGVAGAGVVAATRAAARADVGERGQSSGSSASSSFSVISMTSPSSRRGQDAPAPASERERRRAEVERQVGPGRAARDGERGGERLRLELVPEAAAVRLREPGVRRPRRRGVDEARRAPRSPRRARCAGRATGWKTTVSARGARSSERITSRCSAPRWNHVGRRGSLAVVDRARAASQRLVVELPASLAVALGRVIARSAWRSSSSTLAVAAGHGEADARARRIDRGSPCTTNGSAKRGEDPLGRPAPARSCPRRPRAGRRTRRRRAAPTVSAERRQPRSRCATPTSSSSPTRVAERRR